MTTSLPRKKQSIDVKLDSGCADIRYHDGLPEGEGSDHGVGWVPHSRSASSVPLDPRAKHDGGCQPRRTSEEMNARGASEVDDPKVVEKPMLAPHPSSGNAVHKCTQSRKKAVGMEVCPFSHSPGDDSGGRCSEGQLEDEHGKLFSHYFGIGI